MDKNIQQLLEAERDAQEMINKARHERDEKLRDASKQANLEIKKYRQEKEDKLKSIERQNEKEVSKKSREIEKKTEKEIQEFKDGLPEKLDKVADLLVKTVLNVGFD